MRTGIPPAAWLAEPAGYIDAAIALLTREDTPE